MNNKQLAAARKALRRFPGVRPVKQGDTITLRRAGIDGEPIQVTEEMSGADLEGLVRASCADLSG